MSNRRVIVGQSQWQLPDGDIAEILEAIESGLRKEEVVKLELLDSAGRPVTVLFNGKVVQTVEFDLGGDARPGEVSG